MNLETRKYLRLLEKPDNSLAANWNITPTTATYKWRCVHIHKLADNENQGNHNVYVDLIDEAGQRIAHPAEKLYFGWSGSETHSTEFEKPEWEPGANFMLTAGENAWCHFGTGSDIVNDLLGEAGHTSYYIVFQRQNSDVVTAPHQPNTVIVPMDVILDVEDKLRKLQEAVALLR